MMEVIRVSSKDDAKTRAGREVTRILERHADRPVLLLLSGGSSLGALSFVREEALGENVKIAVLDERYSKDPEVNNFAQVAASDFFSQAREKGVSFIDTRVREGETQEELASRFEEELRSWKERNPEGVIAATVGIGQDGHVAGIMPDSGERDVFDGERWVAGYDTGPKNEHPLRVTATFPLLRQLAHSVSLVTGEEKREALNRVLAEDGDLWETPSRVIREIPDATIVTDIQA